MVIFDEVYVKQLVLYANGTFYGNENDTITKRLLCVTLKSIAGSYRDVITMSPMSTANAETIPKVWTNVVKHTTELDFNIVATTSDGHKSNMKMFRKLLCPGKLQSSVPNPFKVSSKIFLLFDSTHLLKCVYHNFREK